MSGWLRTHWHKDTLITHRARCLSVTVPAGGSSGGEVTSQSANPASNQARQAQNSKVPDGKSSKGHNCQILVTFLLCIIVIIIIYLCIYFNLRSICLDEESLFHTWTLPCDSRCFMGQRLGWTSLSQSGPESHAGRRRQQWRHQRWWGHRNFEIIYVFFFFKWSISY